MLFRRNRRLGTSLSFFCIAALLGTLAPARGDGTDLGGIDPVSRWVAAMPATCGFYTPRETYWVGSALNKDWKQLPNDTKSEWVRHGTQGGAFVTRIRGFYDPVHKIAAYVEYGTDIGNRAVLADAPKPPAGVTTRRDLSSMYAVGNVHLGDTVAQVASEIALKGTLHPSPGTHACKEYSVVGLCSWNRKGCECPKGYSPDNEIASVVFHRGRVVALFWDDGYCGFG